MLRRIHPIQPNGFKFSATNMKWAKEEIKKYPTGRKASAVIPILWRVQEQEGWVSRPAIDCVAKINTGGKYDSKAFKKSVGLNGVGTKAVNALSSNFFVKS